LKLRNKETFLDHISVKDPKTVEQYQIRIGVFEKYCLGKFGRIDILDELKDDWQDTLQAYINWLTRDRSPGTVSNYFASIRKYLHYLDLRITRDDVDENLHFPKKFEHELHPLQLEEIQTLFKHLRYEEKTMHLCQLSTGLKIGEIVQIRKRDFVLGKKRILVKVPAKFAKFKRARTPVLSKEAGIMISGILKRKDDDEAVFGTNKNAKYSAVNKDHILKNWLEKLGMDDRYEETGRLKINTHSFRAYFITKFSRHDPNLAKKLAGEKRYLLQYDRLSDDEILEQYLKVEPDLLIFEDTRREAELQKERADKKLLEEELQRERDKNRRERCWTSLMIN